MPLRETTCHDLIKLMSPEFLIEAQMALSGNSTTVTVALSCDDSVKVVIVDLTLGNASLRTSETLRWTNQISHACGSRRGSAQLPNFETMIEI